MVVGSLWLSGGIQHCLKTQVALSALPMPPPRLSSFRLHRKLLLELKYLCARDDWHHQHLKAGAGRIALDALESGNRSEASSEPLIRSSVWTCCTM